MILRTPSSLRCRVTRLETSISSPRLTTAASKLPMPSAASRSASRASSTTAREQWLRMRWTISGSESIASTSCPFSYSTRATW